MKFSSKDIRLDLGKRLRKLRQKNDLTLAQMSKNIKKVFNLSITPDAISKSERGDRGGDTLEIICRYFFKSKFYLNIEEEEIELDTASIKSIIGELYIPSKLIADPEIFDYISKFHATNYNIKEFSYCFEKFIRTVYSIKFYPSIYKHDFENLKLFIEVDKGDNLDPNSSIKISSIVYPKSLYNELISCIKNNFGNYVTIMDIPKLSKYLIKWFNDRTNNFNSHNNQNVFCQEEINEINKETSKIKYLSEILNLKIKRKERISIKSQILKYSDERNEHINKYIKALKKGE